MDQLVREHGRGSRSALARLLGVGTTHITNWLDNGIAPNAAMLARIASRTGVSIDWLLGFEVPADRDARSVVGNLSLQLSEALSRAAPRFAPLSLVEGIGGQKRSGIGGMAALVRDVTAIWWERQRVLLTTRLGGALSALADRLAEDSSDVSDRRVATLMRQKSREYHKRSILLRSADSSWRELLDLQPGLLCVEIPGVTGVALRNRDETTVAFLQAPFPSLGGQTGVGVGWRPSSRDDEAWYLDASTFEVRRERQPRFFVELTLAERYGPLNGD